MINQCYKLVATGAGTSTQVAGAHFNVSSNHHLLGLWEHGKVPKMEGERNPGLHIGFGTTLGSGTCVEKRRIKVGEIF